MPGFWEAMGQADPFAWGAVGTAVVGHAVALAAIVVAVAAAASAGRPVARWLHLPSGPASRWLTAVGSGFGVVALAQHGIGLASLFDRRVLVAEAAVLLGLGAVHLATVRPWRFLPRPGAAGRAPAVVAAGCLLAAFAVSRLPDTHEDARASHLAAPEEYLKARKIHSQPSFVSWHMPLGAEMIFALGWVVDDIEGAKIANVAAAFTGIAATGRLAAAVVGTPAAWWAAALTAAVGLMVEECWEVKNDLVLTMLVALAGWCAVEAVAGQRRWWLGAGWFFGLAAGVKFSVGFAAGGFVAALIAVRVRPAALALPLFAAGCAGWLGASWLFLGNPVHPFLSGIFPDIAWNPAYDVALSRFWLATAPGESKAAADRLAGVWRSWGDPAVGTPALLALAPLGFLAVRGTPAAFLRWWLAGSYALWAMSGRNARYLLPLVPALAVFAGAAAAARSRGGRAWLGATFILVAMGAVRLAVPDGWRYLAGQMTRPAFMVSRFTTWEDARRWVNAHTGPTDGLLMTGEERRLWFTPRIPAAFLVSEPIPWRLARDAVTAAHMRKRLRQRGLGWWLHNVVQSEFRALSWFPGPAWDARQLAVYAAFVREYLEPVRTPPRVDYANGGFQIFRITAAPSRRPYPLRFLPGTEGAFAGAHRLYRANLMAEAQTEAERTAAFLPAADEALLILAKVHMANRDYDRAVALLEPVNRSGFVSDANHKILAVAAANCNRIELALDQYARFWSLTRDPSILPTVGWCLYKRGQACLARGEAARAVHEFEQAEGCSPEAGAIPYERARALLSLGRGGEALAAARRAAALDPANPAIAALARDLRE